MSSGAQPVDIHVRLPPGTSSVEIQMRMNIAASVQPQPVNIVQVQRAAAAAQPAAAAAVGQAPVQRAQPAAAAAVGQAPAAAPGAIPVAPAAAAAIPAAAAAAAAIPAAAGQAAAAAIMGGGVDEANEFGWPANKPWDSPNFRIAGYNHPSCHSSHTLRRYRSVDICILRGAYHELRASPKMASPCSGVRGPYGRACILHMRKGLHPRGDSEFCW